MLLGEILVKRGRATPAQVEAALGAAGEGAAAGRLGERLVAAGVVREEDVLEALAEQWAVPFVPTVEDDLLDPELVRRLPVEWAREHVMLPVRRNGALCALGADPGAVEAQENLALLLGEELTPLLAPAEEVRRVIERCYYHRRESTQELLQEMAREQPGPAAAAGGGEDLLRVAAGAPVSQLVNLILLEAVRARASDVHLEPFEDQVRVRYRVDGLLYDQPAPPPHLAAALTSRLKVMARLDIAEKRLPQDGMARVRVGEREIDIRVSTVPVAEGERLVLRLLHKESARLSLEQLGMGGRVMAEFRAMIREPQGILLVTGPTGSGKTTTLYAALQELDTRRANIMTIEEPIEYQLPNISQIQVNPRIDLTFSRCLRHVLRQDPDVILVGETRDLETAEIALRASLTGHLVLTTLHTNDAAGAPVRLVDMGVPAYLLSAALRGALAQRLVRRLCPACRRETVLDAAALGALGPRGEGLEGRTVWRAVGCDECLEGYRGRVGLFELLTLTPELAETVRGGAGVEGVRRQARASGMADLWDDAREKLLAGMTSVEEVTRALGRGR